MTDPNQPNPWARPPDGAPEQPVSYVPPPQQQPQQTANWAYDPHQPTSGPPQQQAPSRSLTPIIAIIVAAVILLCVGTAVAGVLVFDQARDAVTTDKSPDPAPPPPTDEPTGRPAPTGAPKTDDPFPLPTGIPNIPDLIPSGVALRADADAKVVYEVTGEGNAVLTYTSEGSSHTDGPANLPWRKEFTLGADTPLLSVNALHFGTSSSELTCRITLDGKEIVKRSVSGNATTASCLQLVVVS
ncbi:MmpS family transport accessory protein [Catenuloplanes japonicus]|uniref:MmpS family transport accessory protein n=1 Tax=Catenuloplanes japonicus TaxID=33876 RepID=UPI000524186A|nr:MmpS family transport accessory protein [Catenuloplanes japonicus]